MCGIIGICSREPAITRIYPGLIALQHRGQDAAGAVTFENAFHMKKGNGLVANVFNPKNLTRLRGKIGIGHVRYPTIGSGSADDAQPFIITSPYGIALAHNGNLVNYRELRNHLVEKEHRYLNSQSDAELILNVLSSELSKLNLNNFTAEGLFEALAALYRRLNGSYAAVAVIARKGLVAFRDRHGIKPLVYATRGSNHAFASESVALDLLGFRDFQDVPAGHALFIDHRGRRFQKEIMPGKKAPCIFEYVYFARPDSVMDGIGVYEARLRLGKELGRECGRAGLKPDVVIPVPDTARGAAQMVAEIMGVTHREGLIKNRYVFRTFIMASHDERISAIRLKLNPIRSEIAGRRVLLIDDSIVRGNTSREIIQLVRDAGAREVYYALYSPPLKYPCVYGIDMQTRGEFIARNRSIESIRQSIRADRLVYQTTAGLLRGVGAGSTGFCTACFTGAYPTRIPAGMMKGIERERLKK
jgi:amidophosphoribosyltransferase